MQLEERVLLAQKDRNERELFISEYKNYISSCSYKTLGRYVTEQDDEFSIAIIAFDEAINKYDKSKGNFLKLASITIKNRLIDYKRKENKGLGVYPFSSLTKTDTKGDENEFDVEDPKPLVNDAKYEIESLTHELEKHNITFFELTTVTPKAKKTKKACYMVINYIIQNPLLINQIKSEDLIPVKVIAEQLCLPRKIIERHRKYIITAVIVLTGDYDIVSGYFKNVKEVL